MILYLPRTKSRRPDGTEVPRTSLRGLNDPVRTEAEVISLLREREKRMPVERPCDSGDAA